MPGVARRRRRPLSPALAVAVVLGVAAVLGGAAAAQSAPPDSLPAYRRALDTMRVEMGELVIGAEAAAAPSGPGAVQVGGAALAALPAASLADVAPLVPGALVQTNSRGETLLYLRGAGERQTLLLLDGAPLAIPWDRRIDLALVPALALGQVEALAGPPALTAGPDALGGAVRFQTRRLGTEGRFYEADASGRFPEAGRLGALGMGRSGRLGWTAAAQVVGSGGDAVASRADLPFSQSGDAVRTNTGRQSASALARIGWAGAAWQGAVTMLASVEEAGVAPEGHLDPAVDRVRYWQRPAQRYGIAVLNAARSRPVLGLGLGATAWAGGFGQTIRQYPDARYLVPDSEQQDRDAWAGARLRAERPTRAGRFALTARAQLATHREQERGAQAALGPDPLYRHLDLGLLADWQRAAGPIDLQAGLRVDRLALLDTGDKPSADGFEALSGFALVGWRVAPQWRLYLSGGRAARFPTLRELFGVALGRFAESTGLSPERAWSGEVGAARGGRAWSGRLVAFGRRTTDAIEQEALPDGRRRRVNLGGTAVVGVETGGTVRLYRSVRLDAQATLQHVREDGGGRLPEKPTWIGSAALAWAPPLGLNARAETRWTGGAVGPDADGRLVELAGEPRLALRLGYRLALPGAIADASLRVDNSFDGAYEPQLGLPVSGRTVGLGVRVLW